MNRYGKEITYYLAINVFKVTVLAWIVLLGFNMLGTFYGNFTNIGKHGFTLNLAALSTVFSSPRHAYELLPVTAIIGLLLGLGQMAAKSELIAMNSVGITKAQIAIGAIVPALLLSGLMFFIYETVGTASEKQALAYKVYKADKLTLAKYSGVWAKEGELFFNARAGVAKGTGENAWLELADIRLYRFDTSGKLESITYAHKANNKSKMWHLKGVEKTTFLPNSIQLEKMDNMTWQTRITNESLEASLSNPRNLQLSELSSNIDYLEHNNLDSRVFTTAYWGRWFYPFKVLVLCLSVLPFTYGSLRTGGLGKNLFLGIVIGLCAFLSERLFVNLSDIYRIDVRFAYLIAPLSVFGLCWGILAKRI